MKIDEFPNYTLGDYIEMDVNATGYMESVARTQDLGRYCGISNITSSKSRQEVTLNADYTSPSQETFSCFVLYYTFSFSFQAHYDNWNTTLEVEFSARTEEWYDSQDFLSVKQDIQEDWSFTWLEDGDRNYLEQEFHTINSYHDFETNFRLPMTLGQEWWVRCKVEQDFYLKERLDHGSWRYDEYSDSVEMDQHLQFIREEQMNTSMGLFDCLVMEARLADEEAYVLTFFNEHFVPVQEERYNATGALESNYQLSSFRFENLHPEEDEEGSSSLWDLAFQARGALLAICLFVLVSLFPLVGAIRKKNKDQRKRSELAFGTRTLPSCHDLEEGGRTIAGTPQVQDPGTTAQTPKTGDSGRDLR